MPEQSLLTQDEQQLLDDLGLVYNRFQRLEVLHGSDQYEMQLAIHQAQNIILSRPAMRQLIEARTRKPLMKG